MVAPIALLIPRAGSAVLAEVLAALAEMLYGSYFGPSVLISGVIQGLVVKVAFGDTLQTVRYTNVIL